MTLPAKRRTLIGKYSPLSGGFRAKLSLHGPPARISEERRAEQLYSLVAQFRASVAGVL